MMCDFCDNPFVPSKISASARLLHGLSEHLVRVCALFYHGKYCQKLSCLEDTKYDILLNSFEGKPVNAVNIFMLSLSRLKSDKPSRESGSCERCYPVESSSQLN